MKKLMKAALIALSVLVGTAGIAAVAAPHSASAKKKQSAPKIDAAAFKTMIAALDKASAAITKQQAMLVTKLKQSQADLEKQIKDAMAEAAAAKETAAKDAATPPATDPAAPPAPTSETAAPAADPAVPATRAAAATPTTPAAPTPEASTTELAAPAVPATPPANPPAAGTAAYEPDASLMETLKKLAAEDSSFKQLFANKELDKLSSLAERWLSADKLLDKMAEANKKLEAGYQEYVKQNKYAEALKSRAGQIELDKKLNQTYGSMLALETVVSNAVVEAVVPASNDDRNHDDGDQDDGDQDDGDHGDGQHGNHDDGKGNQGDGQRKERDNHDD